MGDQRHAPAAIPPGKTWYLLYRKAEWAPRSVLRGAVNLAPTWTRSPDRPARSKSLYRLRFRGPLMSIEKLIKFCLCL